MADEASAWMAAVSRQRYQRGMGDFSTNYAAQLGVPNPFNAVNLPQFSSARCTELLGAMASDSGGRT